MTSRYFLTKNATAIDISSIIGINSGQNRAVVNLEVPIQFYSFPGPTNISSEPGTFARPQPFGYKDSSGVDIANLFTAAYRDFTTGTGQTLTIPPGCNKIAGILIGGGGGGGGAGGGSNNNSPATDKSGGAGGTGATGGRTAFQYTFPTGNVICYSVGNGGAGGAGGAGGNNGATVPGTAGGVGNATVIYFNNTLSVNNTIASTGTSNGGGGGVGGTRDGAQAGGAGGTSNVVSGPYILANDANVIDTSGVSGRAGNLGTAAPTSSWFSPTVRIYPNNPSTPVYTNVLHAIYGGGGGGGYCPGVGALTGNSGFDASGGLLRIYYLYP